MARSIEKGIQGALAFGAYGARQGSRLRKKYKAAPGIGAGIGAIVGGVSSYLSGVPDTGMGKEAYKRAGEQIRSQVMRRANKSARAAGHDVRQAFARRKIDGPLAAGTEAAIRGQIYNQANESLIPFEQELEMLGVSDELRAKRIGEYEKRQGWQDTALAMGAATRDIVGDLAATGETTPKNAIPGANILPEDFGSWDHYKQTGWALKNNVALPENWKEMTPDERMSYLAGLGYYSMGPNAAVPTEWPKEGQFPQFAGDGGWSAYDDDTEDGVTMIQTPSGTWEADKDAADRGGRADRILQENPITKPTPRFSGEVEAPTPTQRPMQGRNTGIRPRPGFGMDTETPTPTQRPMQGRTPEFPSDWTDMDILNWFRTGIAPRGKMPAPRPQPGFVGDAEAPTPSSERPLRTGAPPSSPAEGSARATMAWESQISPHRRSTLPPIEVEATRPPRQGSARGTMTWEEQISPHRRTTLPPIEVEATRPSSPAEGSARATMAWEGQISPHRRATLPAIEVEATRPVAKPQPGFMGDAAAPATEGTVRGQVRQPGGAMVGSDPSTSMGAPVKPSSDFQEEIKDLIDFGEGGFHAKPFNDPKRGVNVGIGRSLTHNGMNIQSEIVPFLQQQGVSGSEIMNRLAAAGVNPNLSGNQTLTEQQFNVLFPDGITPEQGDILLNNDIAMFTSQIKEILTPEVFDQLNNTRKQVLIDMIYTLGASDFREFVKMRDALQEGDYNRAADEMRNSQWYQDVGARRADPLINKMRTGTSGSTQPQQTNTVAPIVQDTLPKSLQDHIAKTAHTPPTDAELREFRQMSPLSYEAVLNPSSPFAGFVKEPYSFQVLMQTVSMLGDAQASEIFGRINQLYT